MRGTGRYRSAEDDGGTHLPHLWARRPTRALPRPGALQDVRELLAAPWRRAPPGPAAARRDPPAVHPLWTADHEARARAVPDLLPTLADVWERAPAAATAGAGL